MYDMVCGNQVGVMVVGSEAGLIGGDGDGATARGTALREADAAALPALATGKMSGRILMKTGGGAVLKWYTGLNSGTSRRNDFIIP